MVINVSEALDSDTSQIITVERTAAGDYVDGLYVKGSTSTFKTLASVQQPTPIQMEVLPEGEKDKDTKLFISKKPILTTNDEAGLIADVVIYKSQRYKVVTSGDWDDYGYTAAMGVRE
jgi:hypothetical protein